MDANAKLSATNLAALSIVAAFGLRTLEEQVDRIEDTAHAMERLESEVRSLHIKIEKSISNMATKTDLEGLEKRVRSLENCVQAQSIGKGWSLCRN